MKPIEIDSRWEKDPPYHPSENNSAYLSQNVVEEIGAIISSISEKGRRVIEVIKKHEELHRRALLGELPVHDADRRIEEAYEDYVKKYGKWPHQEKEYDEFYRILNRGNWK